MENIDILSIVNQMMETFSKFWNFITMSLNDLILKSGLEIDIPIIGDWTLFGLMFGGGLIIYLVVCLAQWVNPL